MFPLQSALLPGETLPLSIFEPRYSQLVGDCLSDGEQAFGVVLISRGREVGGGDVRHDVGALARIIDYTDLGAGRYQLLAAVGERIRVLSWLPDDPYPRALVEDWPDEPGPPVDHDLIGAVVDGILGLYQRVSAARGIALPPDLLDGRNPLVAKAIGDPGRHLWILAARAPIGPADRYAVLAAPTLAERIRVLTEAIESVTAMVEFQLLES